jgi:hypothetical protein
MRLLDVDAGIERQNRRRRPHRLPRADTALDFRPVFDPLLFQAIRILGLSAPPDMRMQIRIPWLLGPGFLTIQSNCEERQVR